jgi:hypothetical protein
MIFSHKELKLGEKLVMWNPKTRLFVSSLYNFIKLNRKQFAGAFTDCRPRQAQQCFSRLIVL